MNQQTDTTAAARRAPSTALLRKLEWRVRHTADSILAGEYRSAFRGRGRDFDQVVKYEYGDEVRDIDWNVTARLGDPYRKKFVEERELTVVLLFEDSLSLQFGSGARTKRDTLLETAGLFSLLCASNRDRAGFWHATPQAHLVREPVRGRTGIVKTASDLLAQPVPSLDADGDVEIDWNYFFLSFPRHSLVLWFGDFSPRPVPALWAALRRRYEIVGVRVEDPWERALPAGECMTAVDPTSGELLVLDTSSNASRRRHAGWVQERDALWTQLFPSPTNGFTVGTQDDPLDALIRFFRRRMRTVKR